MTSTPTEWTVLSLLEWGTDYFDKKGIKNSRLSIEWLLADVLKTRRLNLYLIFDRPVSEEELQLIKPMIKRRAAHEPLQYIIGETDFLNARIKVNPAVLIPRPETEELVDIVLNAHDKGRELRVLDIGTGSGCIPISIKINASNWIVSATDISPEALEVAQENARLNHAEISFVEDDLLNSKGFDSESEFDIIISNPPYILKEEESDIEIEVKSYEPELALFCKSTEHIYRAIFEFAEKHLKIGGALYLELNENRAEEVMSIFSSEKWTSAIHNDYGNKPRFLIAKKN